MFSFVWFTNYDILNALLKMHRSKSALKNLKREYRIVQKMWLIPSKNHCLHAIRFSGVLVWFGRLNIIYLCLYLLFALLLTGNSVHSAVIAFGTLGYIVFFFIPSVVIDIALSRPFFGKFRTYSFEKYHNTKNHTSIL